MTDPAIAERLTRIEMLLEQLVRKKRVQRAKGVKRARSVAERVAADIQSRPTELQRAAARKALLRGARSR